MWYLATKKAKFIGSLNFDLSGLIPSAVSARNGMFLVKTWQVWSHKTRLFQSNYTVPK